MNRSAALAAAPRPRPARPPSPEQRAPAPAVTPGVVMFGSARPVTCAVMDYAHRLHQAIEAQRPGFVRLETIEPDRPLAFVSAIAEALRAGKIAHMQLPIEGWGNSVVPGSALFGARALTRTRPARRHPARMDLAQFVALSLDDPGSHCSRWFRVCFTAATGRVSAHALGIRGATGRFTGNPDRSKYHAGVD